MDRVLGSALGCCVLVVVAGWFCLAICLCWSGEAFGDAVYVMIFDMAYVIVEFCIGIKDNFCVEVCFVDCIYLTFDEFDYDKVEMLYIDFEECIDCDVCVEVCFVDVCFVEDQLFDEWAHFA